MTTLLQEAVDNNVAWCARVCRSHGVLGQYGDGWWVTLSAAPTYYPDAMTLGVGASLETLPRMAVERAGAAVKDSFASVELAGLEVAIEASWIGYERPAADPDPGWSVVRTAGQLAAWMVAHGEAPAIRPDLLADLDVRVLAAFVDGCAVAGLIAYRTGSVVGVSNVFLGGDNGWPAAVAAVAGCFPGLPLVGWESEAMLRSALAAGFRCLGPMRVWRRPASSA